MCVYNYEITKNAVKSEARGGETSECFKTCNSKLKVVNSSRSRSSDAIDLSELRNVEELETTLSRVVNYSLALSVAAFVIHIRCGRVLVRPVQYSQI